MSSAKSELIEQLLLSARMWSTETVMFHTTIAERAGLSPVDTKALDYVARLGPLTPKDLTRHSQLAPASVTALIDRLERKGLVRRVPHPHDRRKVLIEFIEEQTVADSHVWDFIIEQTTAYAETFTTEQLEMIVGFVTQATDITHRATAKLTTSPPVTGE